MIAIGLGTGRCGTKSLAALLNAQKNSVFFHEMNASNLMFEGTEWPILNSINEFEGILNRGDKRKICVDLSEEYVMATYKKLAKMEKVDFIGDVASYYLKYVPVIMKHNKDVRFICMKRGRDATVRSFINIVKIKKTKQRRFREQLAYFLTGKKIIESRNHWVQHNGTIWRRDLKYDKLFPKFDTPDISEAIGKYWDMYNEEAESLGKKYPENFKIFELEHLNTQEGQKTILRYVGFKEDDMVIKKCHENKLNAL